MSVPAGIIETNERTKPKRKDPPVATKKTVHEIDQERAALALEWQAINERIQPDLDRIAAIRAELEQLPVLKYSIPGVDLKLDVTPG